MFNKPGLLILIILFLLAGLSVNIIYAGQSTESAYIKNQIIVKYSQNISLADLAEKVSDRQEKKDSFLGKISLFFENISYKLKGKTYPEEKLSQIQQLDSQIGVVDRTSMSTKNIDENVYLLNLNGSISVEKAVSKLEKSSWVEYARPNYIMELYQ